MVSRTPGTLLRLSGGSETHRSQDHFPQKLLGRLGQEPVAASHEGWAVTALSTVLGQAASLSLPLCPGCSASLSPGWAGAPHFHHLEGQGEGQSPLAWASAPLGPATTPSSVALGQAWSLPGLWFLYKMDGDHDVHPQGTAKGPGQQALGLDGGPLSAAGPTPVGPWVSCTLSTSGPPSKWPSACLSVTLSSLTFSIF